MVDYISKKTTFQADEFPCNYNSLKGFQCSTRPVPLLHRPEHRFGQRNTCGLKVSYGVVGVVSYGGSSLFANPSHEKFHGHVSWWYLNPPSYHKLCSLRQLWKNRSAYAVKVIPGGFPRTKRSGDHCLCLAMHHSPRSIDIISTFIASFGSKDLGGKFGLKSKNNVTTHNPTKSILDL